MFFPRSWCPSTKTSPVTRKWNSNLKLCWKSVGSWSLELDLNCLSCSRELPTCCSWRMIIHWISLCRWLISWPLCGVRLPSPPLPLINGTDARYSAVQTCEFVGDVLCVTKLQTVALAIINRRKAPRWEMKAVRIAADRGGRFFWKIQLKNFSIFLWSSDFSCINQKKNFILWGSELYFWCVCLSILIFT